MASNSGSTSGTASIYKNPFEVEKDQLIRQIFEFPARIAAFVQSQKSDGNGEVMESPFIVLAAKLKARDEMEARHLVSGEKCVPLSNPNETFLKEQTFGDPLVEDADGSHSTVQEASASFLKTRKPAVSGVITYSRRNRKLVNQSGTSVDARSVAAKEVVASSLPAEPGRLKKHDVTSFIIEVIRAVRHTRHGDTQKLFELLSRSDFPVDKHSFLEDLIRQAYCYNKDVVAKQLAQYRNEISQAHPQESR